MITEQRISTLERMLSESRDAGMRIWLRADEFKTVLKAIVAETTCPTTKELAETALLNSK